MKLNKNIIIREVEISHAFTLLGTSEADPRFPVGRDANLPRWEGLGMGWAQSYCCDISQFDIFSRIELWVKVTLELIPSIVLSSKRLITRMTFNSFLSCLMSKESMEITINTSKWHERAKQWNGNSHISLIS